jgi:hypothetical protein
VVTVVDKATEWRPRALVLGGISELPRAVTARRESQFVGVERRRLPAESGRHCPWVAHETEAPVKAIAKDVCRLEDRLGPANGQPWDDFRLVRTAGLRKPDYDMRTPRRRTLWPNGTTYESVELGNGRSNNGRELTGAGFPSSRVKAGWLLKPSPSHILRSPLRPVSPAAGQARGGHRAVLLPTLERLLPHGADQLGEARFKLGRFADWITWVRRHASLQQFTGPRQRRVHVLASPMTSNTLIASIGPGRACNPETR